MLAPRRCAGLALLRNALRVLNAIGGSTNAVIHLAALAGLLGLDWALEDVDRLGRAIPLLADAVAPGAA